MSSIFQDIKKKYAPKALGALGWVGDQLSRGNYASANIAKTLTDKKRDSFGDVMKAGYRGLALKDKTTYSDVLDQAGVKNKYVKAIGGFAGDVLLDPTTYLTLGAGAGAKIATKAGTKTLTKAGTKEFSKLSGNLGREFAEKSLSNIIEKSPQMANKLVDKGGLKFAGKTIPLTDKVVNPVSNSIRNVTGKVGRDASISSNPLFKRQQQGFRDTLDAGISRYTTGYQKAFRGIDKAGREAITRAIDEGKVNLLPRSLKGAAKFAQKELDDILKQEKGRGLIKNGLENYVTHVYENPEDVKKFLNYVNTTRPGTRFAKERAIPTLAEAEALGLKPKLDIEEVLRQRRSSSLRATGKSDLLTEVGNTQGVSTVKDVSKPITENIDANKLRQTDIFGSTAPKLPESQIVKESTRVPAGYARIEGVKELADKAIPTEVAEYIAKLDKQVINSESINGFLKYYDKALNFWKGSVTTLFPSFHVRNAASNVLQNYLDVGMTQSLNPKFHSTAVKVMGGKNANEIVKIGGNKYKISELRKLMQDSGVLQGIGAMDVKGSSSKFNLGRRTGRFIENEARGVNFLANLERIGDPVTAAERTKKFLFDYDNLSDAEKNIMKRVFPFYTWTSKNIALQAEQMIKNPGKFANQFKAQRNATQPVSEQEMALMPDYMKNRFVVKTGEDKTGNPQYIYSFGSPLEGAVQSVAEPLKTATSMLSPAAKAPIELATGQDFFYGKPIKELTNAKDISYLPNPVKKLAGYNEREATNRKGETYKTSTANPYLLYALRQLPSSRVTNTAGKIFDPNKQAGQKALDTLTGVKTASVDQEQQAYFKGKDVKKDIANELVQKGLIKEGGYGKYYIPENVKMSQEEKNQAITIKTLLNNTDEKTALSMATGINVNNPSVASVGDKIDLEVAKENLPKEKGSYQEVGDKIIYYDTKTKEVKDEYIVDFEKKVADASYAYQKDVLKRSDNYKAYRQLLNDRYNKNVEEINTLDPFVDADRITKLRNENGDIENEIEKYDEYGGFKKPLKAKAMKTPSVASSQPKISLTKPQLKALRVQTSSSNFKRPTSSRKASNIRLKKGV